MANIPLCQNFQNEQLGYIAVNHGILIVTNLTAVGFLMLIGTLAGGSTDSGSRRIGLLVV